jgi:cytochrome b subunit of formate dehydrogenase
MWVLFALVLLPGMLPLRRSKFGAGEKALYWCLVATLAVLAVSGGYIHFMLGQNTDNQQLVYLVHDAAAVVAVCFIFLHMYQMLCVHPQALVRVFGGWVTRAWASQFRPKWSGATK